VRSRRVRAALAATAAGLFTAAAIGACGAEDRGPSADVPAPANVVPDSRPKVRPYEPLPEEGFPDGKSIAARAALESLTYARGDSPLEAAARVGPSVVGDRAIARAIEPAVEEEMRSVARVEYAQLSGVTPTSLGAMVIVEQRLQDREGEWQTLTRTVDVRLVRSDGPWQLEEIASVGGSPVEEPDDLSPAAQQVTNSEAIELPDSARWDIYSGKVDEALLETMARLAEKRQLAVTVLDSGHPPNVWEMEQQSAHSVGFAVDIWAVDDVPVVQQQETGTPAYEVASELVAAGAAQVGSPWILGPGGAASFSDDVHRDHIHLQQSPLG
jgi:hypothetical protein